MTEGERRAFTALFDYMAGWNADHMRGVTDHEIQMMRSAAIEGHRILDRKEANGSGQQASRV